MNAALSRMLRSIPEIGKEAQAEPSLAISGAGSASLENLTLYVTGTASAAIDLHSQSVSQVAALLPAGVTASVLRDGPAELLLWPASLGTSAALPVTLEIATAPLWQILAVFARVFEGRRRSARDALRQVNVRAASGIWLEWWGANLGVPRHAGEPDQLYGTRIVATALEPNVNGEAIVDVFAALGYTVQVTDESPGSIEVDVTYPTNPPSGFVYSQQQLAAIVGDVKAAGIIAAINFLAPVTDGATVSETVSASTPSGAMVWGSSRWGEANWA